MGTTNRYEIAVPEPERKALKEKNAIDQEEPTPSNLKNTER